MTSARDARDTARAAEGCGCTLVMQNTQHRHQHLLSIDDQPLQPPMPLHMFRQDDEFGQILSTELSSETKCKNAPLKKELLMGRNECLSFFLLLSRALLAKAMNKGTNCYVRPYIYCL